MDVGGIKKRLVRLINDFVGKDAAEVLLHAKNYFTASFLNNALGFIALPIFTRLLTPEEYGIISIFLSIISIFTVILGLNLHFFLFRYYHERTDDFNQLFGTLLLFIIYINLVLFPLMFVFREPLAMFFEIQSSVFIFAAAVSFFNVLKELLLSYFRTSKQSFKHSFITVSLQFGILALSIYLVIIMQQQKYLGRIYGEFFITLIFAIYFLYRITRTAEFKWRTGLLKEALIYSLPLVPHTLSNHVLSQFDRIIINQLKGASEAGLYSFAYKVGSIMHIFIMGITKAWGPIFFEKMKDRDYRGINSVLNKYSTLLYFLAIGLILFAKEAVIILSDKEYHAALTVVPVIILGYIFVYLYTAFSQYTVYLGKTGLFAANTIIAGIVNVVLNYLFIPRFGYIAAAYTTLFSYFLLSLLHYITIKFILKLENIVPLRFLLPDLLYILAATVFFYIVESYVDNYFISLGCRVVFVIVVFFMLWGKRFLKMIRN